MQPIRRIGEDTPDSVPVPEKLHHRRESIIRPLDEEPQKALSARPRFNIAQVDRIDMPSREERNAG